MSHHWPRTRNEKSERMQLISVMADKADKDRTTTILDVLDVEPRLPDCRSMLIVPSALSSTEAEADSHSHWRIFAR